MSDDPLPILAPGHFVPLGAMAFGLPGGSATSVTRDTPLPVATRITAAEGLPLSGTTSATDIIGPFHPELGRPVILTLAGTWAGTVTLQRSIDGGSTIDAATLAGDPLVYSANLQEPVWIETEAGASLWLDIALADGTLAYRISQ